MLIDDMGHFSFKDFGREESGLLVTREGIEFEMLELSCCVYKSLFIKPVKEDAGLTVDNGFAEAARMIGDDRSANTHSFYRSHAEVFIRGGDNQGFGLSQMTVTVPIGEEAEEFDGGTRQRLEVVCVFTGADDMEGELQAIGDPDDKVEVFITS